MSAEIRIEGNLGDAPVIKRISRGTETAVVVNLSVCSRQRRKNANGEWETTNTMWTECEAWNALAESTKFLMKGAPVICIGTLVSADYEKDGKKVKAVKVKLSAIGLDISRLEGVSYATKGRREPANGGGQGTQHDDSGHDDEASY